MPSRPPKPLPLAALALLLTACATGSARTPRGPEPAAECVVAMANASAGDSSAVRADGAVRSGGAAADRVEGRTPITLAVTTPVDPAHAPSPRNGGERLLFAQLYEPLLRVDCAGGIFPGLARSWTRASAPAPGLERWKFILRPDAWFHVGGRVTAADVIASWRSSADSRSGEPIGALVAAMAYGAVATDDSTLVVTVPDSLASTRTFASPDLAVARQADPNGWPDGTTSYYLDSGIAAGMAAGALPAAVRDVELHSSGAAPALLFRITPGADARDILDAGVDLLATASPSAVQYALTRDSRASIALPWTRSYVAAFTGRDTSTAGTGGGCVGGDAGSDVRALREALAAAVHLEARGAEGPFWWAATADSSAAPPSATARDCSASASTSSASTPARTDAAHSRTDIGPRRILYRSDDSTARELAERIVALAAPGREEAAAAGLRRAAPELFATSGWRAIGLDSLRFAESLSRGRERVYITALPREPEWPAAARASLLHAAPWLAPLGGTKSLVPLVDTRQTLLIRRGRGIPRMTILHDGTIIFDAASGVAASSTP